jgi:hypothetical protein
VATQAEVKMKTYKPGQLCEASGIYTVTHDPNHKDAHEVTVILDKRFPPCNECGDRPRFKAQRLAHHVENIDVFKPK